MTGKDAGRGFPLVGLAVAACVACCVARLLGVIGGGPPRRRARRMGGWDLVDTRHDGWHAGRQLVFT